MKKVLVVLAAVLAIVIIGGLYLFIGSPNNPQDNGSVTSSNTTVSTTSVRQASPKQTVVVSQSFHAALTNPEIGNINYYNDKAGITYTSSAGTVVSFRGVLEQARNSGSTLYLDDTKIGSIEGAGTSIAEFSPDGNNFAFLDFVSSGGGRFNQNPYVLTIRTHTLSPIKAPALKLEGIGPIPTGANTYISSLNWQNNATFQITAFLVNYDENGAFRASHKESWNYDLNSGQYTFVKTLPE